MPSYLSLTTPGASAHVCCTVVLGGMFRAIVLLALPTSSQVLFLGPSWCLLAAGTGRLPLLLLLLLLWPLGY